MWLSRSTYERILKRNDDRDFAAMRSELERVRSDVRGLRTWLQRNLEALDDLREDEQAVEEPEELPATVPAVGGWRR